MGSLLAIGCLAACFVTSPVLAAEAAGKNAAKAAGKNAAKAAAPEAPPEALAEGLFVSVKGRFEEGTFVARSVERVDEDVESIRGRLDHVDVQARTLRIGEFEVALADKSDVQDEQGADIELSGLQLGQGVKISFEARDPGAEGARVVDKVKRRSDSTVYVRIEGPIEELFPPGSAGTRFRVLGVVVQADIDTQWEGVIEPAGSFVINDEDRRPADAIRLGKAGWLSGEVVTESRAEQDHDLTNLLQDTLHRGRLRADVEWTFPVRKHFSGMAELKLLREWVLEDDVGDREDKLDVLLGETWIQLSGIMTKHGSLKIGRVDWDDEREWWFRRDMDTLRLAFQWKAWSVAAAVSQQIVDPTTDLKDARHLLVEARWNPRIDHRLALYVLDRADWYRFASGSERDFEPRHYGFHAEGEGEKLWSYWVDAAIVRGSDRGDQLDGHAFDVGARITWEKKVEPTIVVGYAMGSGDDDPFDHTREDFVQTGLHENNGKWNGVTNFHYYGEVFRPELSNMHIRTVGFGLRFPDDWSVDFAWHDYRLDEFAPELTDADAGGDRRLNLLSKDLGEEYDVIIGYEGLEHWEFEVNLGHFIPGDAWLGPIDEASTVYFKAKYIF